jgi:hypothetical protein
MADPVTRREAGDVMSGYVETAVKVKRFPDSIKGRRAATAEFARLYPRVFNRYVLGEDDA